MLNDSLIDVEAASESASNWDPGCLIRTITTICVPLVFGLIVFVGIFGNALVIIVVATNAQAGTIHKKRHGMEGWVGPKDPRNVKTSLW